MSNVHPRGRQRSALVVLISAQFVVMLDTAVVNVALPSIQSDLGLTQAGLAWVVNAYFLTFGGFLLLSGRAADLFGGRRVFMFGAALFTVTTVIAGLAPNEAVLIGARAAQGLGAAILSPAAMSIILTTYTGTDRAKAMGAWGAASTADGAIGVAAGGLITGAFGWPWVFFVTVPITAAAFALAPVLFELVTKQNRARFDFIGAAAVTGAALSLIFAILSVAERGWASLEAIGGLVLGVVLLAVFVFVERTAADPIVPLALFRDRLVSVGVTLGVLGGAARVSTFFLSALFLQQVLLLEPGVAGFAMVPTSVAGFVVSLLWLPAIIRRFGAERTLTIGLALLAVGHLWIARSPDVPNYVVDVLPALLVSAAGVALSFTPSTMVIASGIPPTKSGLASGLANASSQIGGAFGIASFSAVAVVSAAAGLRAGYFAAAIVAAVAATLAMLGLPRAAGSRRGISPPPTGDRP